MRFLSFVLALMLTAPSVMAHAARVEPPREPIEQLNAALVDTMKDADRLGYQGRYKKLAPVVKQVFRFDTIARTALGKYWQQLSPHQQQVIVAKLTELSIATYASQFNSYDGQLFRYESSETTKPDRALLRYTMVVPKRELVAFEYIVDRDGTKWQIVNIVVDGISDLALKKAQYTSIMEREGFDSLLAKLSQKIDDYARK